MKNYLLISIGFVFVLIVLGLVDYCVVDNSTIEDYLRGTFTETLGIIVTLIFVQLIFSRHEKSQAKLQELEAIKRADKVLSIYIKNYIKYASQVVTPITQRDAVINGKEIPSFTFNDMQDLFLPSLIAMGDQEPVVLKALQAQDDIKKSIESILLNIDFKYFSSISELFLNYLEVVGKYSLIEVIKFHSTAIMGKDDSVRPFIAHMIKEHSGKVQFYPANIINPYVALFNLINYHKEFFNKYDELSKSIGIRE